IVLKINSANQGSLNEEVLKSAQVAIEISTPESAVNNILLCFSAGVPVVCGTTGWLERLGEVTSVCNRKKLALLYASNFSIGVNIFFEINKILAGLMIHQSQYEISIEETHHTEKKDSPSGTAISLAQEIMERVNRKHHWVNEPSSDPDEISILSKRMDEVPGTHLVKYSSSIDTIEIIHTAHNRKGFATGAITAAEWILDKRGLFDMRDVLGLK
ncbi:MAG: 4-hydroxy-tetrahydrodipicolinate reductase, partial [Chitinophagaceae bacterium]